MNEEGREVWQNPASSPVRVLEENHWACPRQTLKENPLEWSRLLFYYDLFKKGHLPDEGSVSSQSNAMMEILRIIDNENADCDRIIAEKEARKQKRRK